MTIGERIIYYRTQRGLNQPALARLAHVPISTLNVLERGKRQGDHLTVATARRLARALGISLDELVGMEEVP